MDWRVEYNNCMKIATENSEAGFEQGYSYWTGRADGVRWLGEIVDRDTLKQLVQQTEQ